jgi:NADPH-dependent F420 reductase
MKVAVLGTGMVGQAHAGKLVEHGHKVVIGTNNVSKTLAKTEPNAMGRPPFSEWIKRHKAIKLVTFSDAAKHGEVIFCALSGDGALKVLKELKTDLAGKVLVDITNPLDFSNGFPPFLSVVNTDSLGEQIQKALPQTKVVKAFNTMNADVQVAPKEVANSDHELFIAGNDDWAKTKVKEIAKSYGWKNILDLGDIKSARGMEMILPIWLMIMNAKKTSKFNFKIA